MGSESGRLQIEIPAPGSAAFIGELHWGSLESIRAAVEQARATLSTGELVLDLSGIEFCDSSGLGALVWAHNTMPEGSRLVVHDPSPSLSRLLELTGLHTVLTIVTHGQARDDTARSSVDDEPPLETQ